MTFGQHADYYCNSGYSTPSGEYWVRMVCSEMGWSPEPKCLSKYISTICSVRIIKDLCSKIVSMEHKMEQRTVCCCFSWPLELHSGWHPSCRAQTVSWHSEVSEDKTMLLDFGDCLLLKLSMRLRLRLLGHIHASAFISAHSCTCKQSFYSVLNVFFLSRIRCLVPLDNIWIQEGGTLLQ